MLRRSRPLVPALTVLAFLLGRAAAMAPWAAALTALLTGLAVGGLIARRQERRLRTVADQVVRFASEADGTRPPAFDGGREWQPLVVALNEVQRVLRDRFDELRAERARVERVLDGLPTAVLLFTEAGLAYANPAAQALFGVTRTADWTPLRLLGSDALATAVSEARRTSRPVDVAAVREGRDLVGHAARVAPDEVALIVSDVTEARRVEAMRRDFVANASHELKTPVTGMQALADSLGMALDRDPDRARTMVGRVQHEATRLARLVRDLLDLTRLEERTDGRTRHPVDLADLCRTQCDRLRPLAEELEVTLDCPTSGGVTVVGIPEDMRLVVANLLSNAIQYNRPGGEVVVRVSRVDGAVTLVVADTGIGIPEVDQDRVFERFYRVDKARSRALGGTGLGLSLVRNAVERHDGRVTVDSVLGEGSTFTVELPVEGAAG